MRLLSWFFPEQSEAISLEKISERLSDIQTSHNLKLGREEANSVHVRHLIEEVDRRKKENGQLALCIIALLKIVQNVTGVERELLAAFIKEIDKTGAGQGVDMDILRHHFGLPTPPTKAFSDGHCPACSRRSTKKFGKCVYCGWDLSE